MSQSSSIQKIQSQWVSKSLIGAILSYTLALLLVGIFAWQGPGGIDASNKVQFNMWFTVIIWLCIFSSVYLFKTALRAFCWLTVLNVFAFSLFILVKQ
ncbi:MAG: hypothetical protein BM565_07855 [Gammaproteobacteria bacterium MedPE]|nr:MAG: hypothetical protein BM565_07855 [Gammaproteobacteria bacterium MedPE]